MKRFVILKHDRGQSRHWDLMLEAGEVLATWQVEVEPATWQEQELTCHKLADHRRVYLDYEGPISGGRGEVHRTEAGTYKELACGRTRWEVELRGERLQGRLVLEQKEQDIWKLRFKEEQT